MINSKKKGNRFELEIAKILTELTNTKWYRVGVSSGARFTTIGAEKYQGDVTTDDSMYQNVIIECKATKNRITLEDIANPKSRLYEWINQAKQKDKKWILFFKANNGSIFYLKPDNQKDIITSSSDVVYLDHYTIRRIIV